MLRFSSVSDLFFSYFTRLFYPPLLANLVDGNQSFHVKGSATRKNSATTTMIIPGKQFLIVEGWNHANSVVLKSMSSRDSC